jgi:hypothetical protein
MQTIRNKEMRHSTKKNKVGKWEKPKNKLHILPRKVQAKTPIQ